ncbi:MAG: DUF3078 domain-containing protein [Bacteroidia bacterium]
MKRLFTILALIAMTGFAFAQDTETTGPWTKGSTLSLNFTNTGFSNYWQGGGANAIGIGGLVNLYADYNKGKFQWANTLDMAYGRTKVGDQPFLKSDDRIELNSKAGVKLQEKLLGGLFLNFRTQFDLGFDGGIPNNTVEPGTSTNIISRLFNPAYLNLGLGLDWQPNANTSIAFAPINAKFTIVGDEALRPLYVPLADIGSAVRTELGANLGVKYRRDLAENVAYQTSANFFTNYLENFGNVDVNWDQLFSFKVNKFLSTTFATSLIYDDDIRFALVDDNGVATGATGPRTQFRHVLSIGFVYSLGDKKE